MSFPHYNIENLMLPHITLQNSYHLIVDKQINNGNSIIIVKKYNDLCKLINKGAAKLIYEDILLYINHGYDADFINFMRHNAIIISILTYLSNIKNNSKNLTFAKELMDKFNIKPCELKKYL